MDQNQPSEIRVSLVISTRGRTAEIERLFDSLTKQDCADFEVLIVDQNGDDRLDYLTRRTWAFPLIRMHRPDTRGLSRGRNIGWKAARGELVIFPDDDCWYPSWFLSCAEQKLRSLGADVLTGRAADETGRSINGRYLKDPERISRSNVWISGIEWVMMFKKSLLVELCGFDETIGVGADTPWQACEGQDLLLRAFAAGKICHFDPALFGHHEELNVDTPDDSMIKKGRGYARGLGYVLRINNYSIWDAFSWISRPLAKLIINVFKGDPKQRAYLLNVAIGRFEGYTARVWN